MLRWPLDIDPHILYNVGMNNNNDVIDDYFNTQLAKCPVNHGKLATAPTSKEEDAEAIKIAKVITEDANDD